MSENWMIEDWMEIAGFENYEISNSGRVRNSRNGHLLKQQTSSWGYGVVNFCKTNFLVHRLVAKAFIPNPENKPQVNHKDGNKLNNDVSNLEWVSKSENIRHRIDVLGINTSVGEKHPSAKLTNNDVLRIRKALASGAVGRRLAEKYNVCPDVISGIKTRRTWKHLP